MNPRALVTGANGFIGRHLVRHLLDNGWDVAAASRRPLPGPADLEYVPSPDLSDSNGWSTVVQQPFDALIHLAGRVHVMRDDPAQTLARNMAINADGTERLALAAEAAGVRRFILVSSVKVYGDRRHRSGPLRATDPASPDDAYGISKLCAEQRLLSICGKSSRMDAVIIRPTLVYGPGVKANFHSMMRWVELGLPLPLGAVHNRRSMIYVGNLNSLIRTAALSERAPGGTFLAADATDVSTSQLLTSIATAMKRPSRLIPVPVPLLRLAARLTRQPAVARRLLDDYRVDVGQTMQQLRWTPPHSWREGLAATVTSYLESKKAGQ